MARVWEHCLTTPRRKVPRKTASPRLFAEKSAQGGAELRKDRAYELILLDIILGDLPPSARLDENELARRYGEGLAAIRDALGRLALEGMVDRRPRAGTFVTPLDLLELDYEYEARRLIEPDCAALAAVNGSEEDLREISAAFAEGQAAAAARDWKALVRMDQRFHAAVGRACRNRSLEQVLVPLQYKAARYWIYWSRQRGPGDHLASVLGHQEVAARIVARDPDGARAAMLAVMGEPPSAPVGA